MFTRSTQQDRQLDVLGSKVNQSPQGEGREGSWPGSWKWQESLRSGLQGDVVDEELRGQPGEGPEG